jgi:3-phenylpropionate/cinnamic acid dioxygenase small subunit
MPGTHREPADGESSHRAIAALITRYAELVDEGDFAGLGALLADAAFVGGPAPVTGGEAIRRMFEDTVIVYDDGTPRTQHVTTNVTVQVDEDAGTATARAYVTVLQALPEYPLQPIAAGRYHDRFERHDGQWRFVERRVGIRLLGDVSHHLRGPAAERR